MSLNPKDDKQEESRKSKTTASSDSSSESCELCFEAIKEAKENANLCRTFRDSRDYIFKRKCPLDLSPEGQEACDKCESYIKNQKSYELPVSKFDQDVLLHDPLDLKAPSEDVITEEKIKKNCQICRVKKRRKTALDSQKSDLNDEKGKK